MSETETTKLDITSQKITKTSYLMNSCNRTVSISCRNHVCLTPCAATHTYIAAMHIEKTTSNNEDDKNKLG